MIVELFGGKHNLYYEQMQSCLEIFGYTSHKVGFEAKAKPWLETDEKSFKVD